MRIAKNLIVALSVVALSAPVFAANVTNAQTKVTSALAASVKAVELAICPSGSSRNPWGGIALCPSGTSRNPWGGIALCPSGTSRNPWGGIALCPSGTSRNPWGGIAPDNSAS